MATMRAWMSRTKTPQRAAPRPCTAARGNLPNRRPRSCFRDAHKQSFVNQVTLRSVRQHLTASFDSYDLLFDPDRRGQTAEEKSTRFEQAPGPSKHAIVVNV